jgi:hypothetical protein
LNPCPIAANLPSPAYESNAENERATMAIQISVTGLAKFMKSRPANQRAMLKTYKFQTDKNGNKRPQIVRYSEARSAIKKYHSSGNDIATLIAAVAALQRKDAAHSGKGLEPYQ